MLLPVLVAVLLVPSFRFMEQWSPVSEVLAQADRVRRCLAVGFQQAMTTESGAKFLRKTALLRIDTSLDPLTTGIIEAIHEAEGST